MTAHDFIDHTGSAGSTPQARPCRLGSTFRHRWNLMHGGYTRIGIAFGIASNGC